MDNLQFLDYLNSGKTVVARSEAHQCMHQLSIRAQRITAQINGRFCTPQKRRKLLAKLTNKAVPDTFTLFPPFFTDCGINITVGQRVFVNSCCCFQDQGGITIGDDTLIGHNVVIATLNHHLQPQRRADMLPKAVVIGKNVWIGSHSTILPGVTIGDNAVIGAGSVVTKDVAPNTVVAGVPAKVIKVIE